MKYMGSKRRISKNILPILNSSREGRPWVEPFVGGGNLIDKVSGTRIGSDFNKWTIEALVSIRDFLHELPKNNTEFTEQDYKNLRNSDAYKHKGYAGFALSYGGKWLGGWCRDGANRRDYVREAYLNAVKQSEKLQGVTLINSSYTELSIPNRSFIYCDPPYKNSTKYSSEFDHDSFWDWTRLKRKEGHIVYVSEYSAPSFCECVWEGKITSSLTQDTGSKVGVERLFKVLD